MAVFPKNGLQSYVQRTQQTVGRTPGTSVNPSVQKMLTRHMDRTNMAMANSPVAGKNVNTPNAARPQPEATADIKAPILEGQSNVANTQEGVNTPTVPQETHNPMDTSAIDDMGSQSNKNEEMLAAQRKQGAGQANGGGWGTGTSDGGILDGLDAEQSQFAQLIITNGRNRGMNESDIQTALMTALAESGMRNVNYGDRDSVGLFQQRTSQGWGTIQQIMDPNYSINKFYDSLAGVGNRGGMTQWQAAQAVQRSAFADGSNYQAQAAKAMQIYQSYSTGAATAPTMGANGSASWINANNGKYHDYDGAYGAQCVDLYNFYATGFVGANPNQARVVGAKDIWNNYDTRAMTRVQAGQRPQQGDVVVWGSSWGGGYGHVGIVAGVNPDGTLKVLNANATSAGSKGNTVISNYGTGGILGYLRPNKLMGVK